MMGESIAIDAMRHMGPYPEALIRIERLLKEAAVPTQRDFYPYRIGVRSTYANILLIQGFQDQALDVAKIALEEARAVGNASLLVGILAKTVCQVALFVGDLDEAEQNVELLLDLSAKTSLNNWNALGCCMKGSLLHARGEAGGLALYRAGVERLRKARFTFSFTICLGGLAQVMATAGEISEAHPVIDEALERAGRNAEQWCLPELLRIKGELLQLDGSAQSEAAAEDLFLQALDEARRQKALSWELRAAMSLARLRRAMGRTAEARDLLQEVHGRFTEGFDAKDLRAAGTLLDELGAGH
jgi:ATP/maltotriose-dependent transcriptional regulator MalT